MPTLDENPSSQIKLLVEPSDAAGVKPVAHFRWKKEDLVQKSEDAITNAMKTIQKMAILVDSTVKDIQKEQKLDKVEVVFGIKFDGELDVVIAKAGVEASISVTLSWNLQNYSNVNIPTNNTNR